MKNLKLKVDTTANNFVHKRIQVPKSITDITSSSLTGQNITSSKNQNYVSFMSKENKNEAFTPLSIKSFRHSILSGLEE
jgi:hypothetical protein